MSTVTEKATPPQVDEPELTARVNEIRNRHPAIGLAVGVVRDSRLAFFSGHGLAEIASHKPITEDTVFRIASITKTFTAIAVMQLWEQGLLDLDAPANDYLRAYKLIPARPNFCPATVRHLLTHTAGIPEVVYVTDLLHPGWGQFGERPAICSVKVGEPQPSLAEYYQGRLQLVVEPGTAFAYSNHGFATLGQLVEDVSGMSLDRYFRVHIFEPLGMADTDLVRSERVKAHLATGYDLSLSGAAAVTDRDWLGPGGGGIYSSSRDMAHYVAALLNGGANEHGSVLQPATLATMFLPQYQPDPRLTGMGLAFFRHDAGGHRVVSHEGVLPGFHSALVVAPDDGLGLIAVTNGASGAMVWLPCELERLLRQLLGVPEKVVRSDIPQHPEVWSRLCGRYRLPPRVSDLRGRVMMGSGVQIFVRGGRLMMRVLTPFPALYAGLPLHPDDDKDPYMFRLDLSPFGMPAVRLAFHHGAGGDATVVHTDLGSQPVSFHRQPAAQTSRLFAAGALGALAVVGTVKAVRQSHSRPHKETAR